MTGAVRVDKKLTFLGCSVTSRLFCVGLAEGVRHAPVAVYVDECPLCGNSHRSSRLSWRNRREGEGDRQADVVVGGDGRQTCGPA